MNDFTKEELQIIHLDMTMYVNKTPMLNESPSHKSLRDKIKSMIDDYCEHRNVKSLTDDDWVYHCCECDKIVGYQ